MFNEHFLTLIKLGKKPPVLYKSRIKWCDIRHVGVQCSPLLPQTSAAPKVSCLFINPSPKFIFLFHSEMKLTLNELSVCGKHLHVDLVLGNTEKCIAEEPEAQRGQVMFPRSHSWQGADSDEPGLCHTLIFL